MGKGIILRVMDGTQLSPEISGALKKLLPDYSLHYFSEKPNYHSSIERRVLSLYQTFFFMMAAHPIDPAHIAPITLETIRAYLTDIKMTCDAKLQHIDLIFSTEAAEANDAETKQLSLYNRFKELHLELEKFNDRLVDLIAFAWKWQKDTDARKTFKAFLNEAEPPLLMMQGRADIATLIPMSLADDTAYILQWDESLPPYYDQWIAELEQIKALNFPITPNWYLKLTEAQQAYFDHIDTKKIDESAMMSDIDGFIVTWRKLQDESNKSNFTNDLLQIKNQAPDLSLPDWFKKELSPSFQAMLRALLHSQHDVHDTDYIEAELNELKKKLIAIKETHTADFEVALIAQIPQWYWVLSSLQKSLLQSVLKTSDNLEEVLSFIPSRYRTLPAPANYSAHRLYKISCEGQINELFHERIRSSHMASRDALKFPFSVQQYHSRANFAKVTERAKTGQMILVQTLISPIHVSPGIAELATNFIKKLPPDSDLYDVARNTVRLSEHADFVVKHNHPLNLAKFIYFTQANDENSLDLLKKISPYTVQFPELQTLIDHYKSVLIAPPTVVHELFESTYDRNKISDCAGRELFLSSLEQLMILTIKGFSYGSCISGKDRKAIELIHTDAMILYKEKYGVWPQYATRDSQERRQFVELVVVIYLSRHHHELAGQNAPGAEGIKTPDWYWPSDISEAINQRLGTPHGLKFDNRLATDNEIENIYHYLKPDELGDRCHQRNRLVTELIAQQLGETHCTYFYDILYLLINQKNKFETKSFGIFPSTPDGIGAILEVMADQNAGNSVDRLAKIFAIVLNRPVGDKSRKNATRVVYDGIRSLCTDPKHPNDLVTRAIQLGESWKNKFKITSFNSRADISAESNKLIGQPSL